MSETALILYDNAFLDSIIRKRAYEQKLGEHILSGNSLIADKNLTADVMIVGLPEDIGVAANFGRRGASTAWKPALDNILNIQHNLFIPDLKLGVLGHVNFEQIMLQADKLNPKIDNELEKLRNLTAKVDEKIIEALAPYSIKANRWIFVGGGHNNSYPILKLLCQEKSMNCINIDPHSDLRPLEGRHSGNGFSYAVEHGFLKKYFVLGLHENYNSQNSLLNIDKSEHLKYITYEQIFIREEISWNDAINESIIFCSGNAFGLEIDLDAIQNIPSSAKTSSGLLPVEVRKAIFKIASHPNCKYLHIAEGAPVLSHIKTDNKTGKLIAYLISDFIKASAKNI